MGTSCGAAVPAAGASVLTDPVSFLLHKRRTCTGLVDGAHFTVFLACGAADLLRGAEYYGTSFLESA